jgi:hypothetical protein
MKSTPTRGMILTLACLAMVVASVARGQESLFGPPFKEPPFYPGLSVREGKQLADETGKVLIVVFDRKQAVQGRRDKWENDTLRAWLMWHAIVVEPKAEELSLLHSAYPVDHATGKWGMYMFCGERRYKLFWPKAPPIAIALDPREREQFQVTAIMALFELDRQLERAMADQPLWGFKHAQKNPAPEPPVRLRYADGKDGHAPAFKEPVGREDVRDGERPRADVLGVLREAREHVERGREGEAIAALTWLFERGHEEEPAFDYVRQTLVVDLLRQVSKAKGDHAQLRLDNLVNAEFRQYAWADYEQRYEYLALACRTGAMENAAIRLDVEVNDPDEAAMIPAPDLMAVNIMADRLSADARKPVSEAWINNQVRLLKSRRPDRADAEEWKRMLVFRKWMIVRECVRSFALLMERDQPDQAMGYARRAIEQSADEASRTQTIRALALISIVLDREQDQARAWLDEVGEGKDSPIRKHLRQ